MQMQKYERLSKNHTDKFRKFNSVHHKHFPALFVTFVKSTFNNS